MRYENWDALIFPKSSKAPLQEFKNNCYVVHDLEFVDSQTQSLPIVTAFVPGLEAGQPFRVSLHSWETPEHSRYCQSFLRHGDRVVFEARLLIDGGYITSRYFERMGPWPKVIDTVSRLDRHDSDQESLSFPTFHHEQISQSFWNAGDDMGRIKLVIAEGIYRDNLPSGPTSFQRIKNVVAFAFQHAPLEILEGSGIAWPNAAMWRHPALSFPIFSRLGLPTETRDISGSIIHTHSNRNMSSHALFEAYSAMTGTPSDDGTSLLRLGPADPESVNEQVPSRWRHVSSDVSMPDCTSLTSGDPQSRRITGPLGAEISERNVDLTGDGKMLICLPVPADTPQASTANRVEKSTDRATPSHARERGDSQDESGMNHDVSPQSNVVSGPRGIVRSRKENMPKPLAASECSSAHTGGSKVTKSRSSIKSPIRNRKKQHLSTTPTSSNSTEAEDELQGLVRSKKLTAASFSPDHEEESRVLRDVESNIL